MNLAHQGLTKKLMSIFLFLALCQPAMAAPLELSLADSVALALNNNPDMKIAQLARDNSRATLRQAKAGEGVALTFVHTDMRADGYDTRQLYLYGIKEYVWSNKYDNQFALSLPLYSGGKLEGQVDQANLNLKVAELNVEATKQQLKELVTGYYYSVLQCRNNLQVSQETVENYTAHLKNVQAQYDVGIVAKSDILASQVSLANAQDGLMKAQNNYDLAIADLNNAIDLPLGSEIKLKEELAYQKNNLSLDTCIEAALANRPEMEQYRAKIAIAQDDVKIAKSGYFPAVNFVATQDWYDDDFPGAKNGNWSVGLTTSLNVFDSGLNDAKLSGAKTNLATAEEQARKNRDAIILEVRQQYLSMREAEKRIETSEVAVAQGDENLRIAELRYNAGVGTNLDVLDSVLALNQSKTNYIQALYDYNTSKAKLDKAMGIAVK